MLPKLVLASASPRREELLKQLGLRFTIVPSRIDESQFDNLPPAEMVCELARAKAEEVAELVEDTLVIAADTIVVCEGKVLGKPADHDDAEKMLKKLRECQHTVLTGLAVLSTFDDRILIDYDQTEVYMRYLEDDEIEGYIKTGEPMDKAGAYGIQGLGGMFIKRIDGSYFTVMGLPLHKLAEMLKSFTIKIV